MGLLNMNVLDMSKHCMYYALTTLKKSVVFDDNGQRVKFGGAEKLTDGNIKAMNVYL